jgi:hypothetical protein
MQIPLAILIYLYLIEKFQMTVTYELLEERKATASFPATFLIELTISGKWCGPKGFEKLQAIGKTTREAKFKAAESGIVRIKKLKPGLAYDIGVLPPEWQNWLYDNLEKGGKPKKLLKILVEKGFSPSKNPILMQRISCKASSLRLRKKVRLIAEIVLKTTDFAFSGSVASNTMYF